MARLNPHAGFLPTVWFRVPNSPIQSLKTGLLYRAPNRSLGQRIGESKRWGALILVLLIACGGSVEPTSTTQPSIPTSDSTVAPSTTTTTTVATALLEANAEVVCYSFGSGPDQHDITVTVSGEPGSSVNGVLAWGSSGAELFNAALGSEPVEFSFSKEVPGPGRVVITDDLGERIEIPVKAGVCETVVPDTILEIDAVAFCFEGGEPVVEYTVLASPGIGTGGDVTVFVTDIGGELIYAETFDGPVAEGSGSIGLGDRLGRVTVNATASSGESSPISFLEIPVCAQAPLIIVTAEAACISADVWELTLGVEGEPGVAGNYFYSWVGSIDGEVGEFRIDPDGLWGETLPWPGDVKGQVSLVSFEGDGFGPIDVDVLPCSP